MNTHSSFHHQLMRTEDPHVAYDIALRVSTYYEPTIAQDRRLNHTRYRHVALSAHGAPLALDRRYGASEKLRHLLQDSMGECHRDPNAFICHAFARSPQVKQQLGQFVAHEQRARLEKMLSHRQGVPYRNVADAAAVH